MSDGYNEASQEHYLEGQYRPVRVLTFNVKGGEGGDGRNGGCGRDYLALEPIASLIESLTPDLVALQEIAAICSGDEACDQVGYLASRLGMHHAFAPVEGFPLLQSGQTAGRDFWGNAVLSRVPITAFRVHDLCSGRPSDARSLLETQVEINGVPLSFFSVHLSYIWQTTLAQCRELAAVVQHTAGPLVVTGDFNAGAGSAELLPLHAILEDTFSLSGIGYGSESRFSFPEGTRKARDLDHIFVGGGVRLGRTFVYVDESRVSDHNPVVADLLVPVPVAAPTVKPEAQPADHLLA